MKNLIEVRVVISPTPFFFRRVHFLAASLKTLADMGPYEITVAVGEDVEPYNLYAAQPWSQRYPLTWRWVDREAFRRDSYWETSREVFRQHGAARFVMHMDADCIFIRSVRPLLDELERHPALAGVIAHSPAFAIGEHPETPNESWRRLFDLYGVPQAPPIHETTGWGILTDDPERRFTPPYFNFGMIVGPYELMDKLNLDMIQADLFAAEHVKTNKRFQIGLTLAIQKHRIPVRILPFRYNFANDPRFDERYADELARIRVLHYTRKKIVNRDRDFESLEAVEAFLARTDLTGSNEVLRRKIAKLYPMVREEELAGLR